MFCISCFSACALLIAYRLFFTNLIVAAAKSAALTRSCAGMSDKPEEKKDEIPAFRITEKKVDDSWKEEMRREKMAAASKAQPAQPQREAARSAPAAPGAEAAPKEAPAAGLDGEEAEAAPEAAAAKPKGTPQEQQQTRIFMGFLAQLAQQALMQLGEMENPFSGQVELDLQGARVTIEILNVILAKTKGNLTPEEEESLSGTIHDLKLRYVEVANEVQRQMAAQMQKGGAGGAGGPMRPGPGGAIPGPGAGRRR
jgi:hypothetical protein